MRHIFGGHMKTTNVLIMAAILLSAGPAVGLAASNADQKAPAKQESLIGRKASVSDQSIEVKNVDGVRGYKFNDSCWVAPGGTGTVLAEKGEQLLIEVNNPVARDNAITAYCPDKTLTLMGRKEFLNLILRVDRANQEKEEIRELLKNLGKPPQ